MTTDIKNRLQEIAAELEALAGQIDPKVTDREYNEAFQPVQRAFMKVQMRNADPNYTHIRRKGTVGR